MKEYCIENVNKKVSRLLQIEKNKYIDFIFNEQNKRINDAIINGENATGWILGSYGGGIKKTAAQQEFHKELDAMFKPKFEQAGYTIIGNIIKW